MVTVEGAKATLKFKEDVVVLSIKGDKDKHFKHHTYNYSNKLLKIFDEKGVKLPFNIWIKVLQKIKGK